MKRLKYVLFFILTLSLCPAAHAAFEMTVGRTTVTEGETFQIYLRQDKDVSSVDISPLFVDFNVVGRQQSSRTRIVNGKKSQTYELILTLAPKKTGMLTLPALTSGNESSKPVAIKVLSAEEALSSMPPEERDRQETDAVQSAPKVFLRAEVSDAEPMEKTPVIYTVRLFFTDDVMQGGITAPSSKEFVLKQTGEPTNTQETVGGVSYQVTEYNFALFAQRTGKITVPPAVFNGTVVASDFPDLMNDDMDDMFNFGSLMRRPRLSSFLTGRTVSVNSPSVVLNVKAPPAGAGDDFLPASDVTLSENFSPDAQSVTQGDVVTRTVTLTATGTIDSELPEIVFPDGTDYKQYPSKSEGQTFFKGKIPVARKTRQIVFIPSKSGRVVLPRLSIPWYDTATKTSKTAVLPERVLNVLPLAGATEERPSVAEEYGLPEKPDKKAQSVRETAAAEETSDENAAADYEIISPQTSTSALRMFLAGAFLGAALILGVWFAFKVRGGKNTAESQATNAGKARKITADLKEACFSGNPQKARDALKAFAALYWRGNEAALSLTDIADRLGKPAFCDEVAALNEVLYGHDGAVWDGRALFAAFEDAQNAMKTKSRSETSAVPPLYPL